MLNAPVSGSRTWMCTMAAPACAASIAAAAICSGVTGQCGLFVSFVSSPVIAQVIMTSKFMAVLAGSAGTQRALYYNHHDKSPMLHAYPTTPRPPGFKRDSLQALH